MANYAEILGNTITFYERTMLDSKPLAQFLDEFQPSTGWISERLPEGVVFVSQLNDITLYVVEREPRFVTLHVGYGLDDWLSREYAPEHDSGMGYYYKVPVPWEYYMMSVMNKSVDTGFGQQVFQSSALTLYWAKSQVTELTQPKLVAAHLPNVSVGGNVCMGDNTSEYQIPHEKMTDTVYNFYESTFNSDLGFASGPCEELYSWLDYHREHDRVNMDDPEFDALPADGETMEDVMRAAEFKQLTPPDGNMPSSNRGFLQRLMATLPEQDGRRLISLLREVTPPAQETQP